MARPVVDLAVIGGGVAGTYVAFSGWFPASGLVDRAVRTVGSHRWPAAVRATSRARGPAGRAWRHALSRRSPAGRRARPIPGTQDPTVRGGPRRQPLLPSRSGVADGYQLTGSERGRSPAELLAAAFDRIVPGAMHLTDREWQDARQKRAYRDRPLFEWTCRDALLTVMSAEAYQLIVDWLGYSATIGERNAADAIPYVVAEMKPEADDQVAVVGGMDRLPRTMAARVEANGGEVHLASALDRFEGKSSAGGAIFRLHFEGGASVLARRIVFALPRLALEALAHRSLMLQSSAFGRLAGSVAIHDAAKLFLTYERAWWRDAGIQGHRLVTDLPLRKVFYFDRIDGAEGDGSALLLATYTDTTDVEAWRWLARQVSGPARATDGGLGGAAQWDAYAASPAQIDEAQRQLRTVHGLRDIPAPTGAAFKDWGAGPEGGGWFFWRAGVQSSEVMDRIMQPDAGSQVFVCGDAYSVSQGWIEGALQTADQVVARLS